MYFIQVVKLSDAIEAIHSPQPLGSHQTCMCTSVHMYTKVNMEVNTCMCVSYACNESMVKAVLTPRYVHMGSATHTCMCSSRINTYMCMHVFTFPKSSLPDAPTSTPRVRNIINFWVSFSTLRGKQHNDALHPSLHRSLNKTTTKRHGANLAPPKHHHDQELFSKRAQPVQLSLTKEEAKA